MEKATLQDIDAIVKLKIVMFEESGHLEMLAENAESFIVDTYQKLYEAGEAQHFVIRENGCIVACAGGFIKRDIPYCFMKTPFYGFIGDVYTAPEKRGNGYAKTLTGQVLNWLAEKGVSGVCLLASRQARRMYEKMGFKASDEMWLSLKADS